jgi:hypothetical protein
LALKAIERKNLGRILLNASGGYRDEGCSRGWGARGGNSHSKMVIVKLKLIQL